MAFIILCLLSPVFMAVFVVPATCHHPCHLLSPLFVLPAICSPPFILPAICCHGCSHGLSFSVFVVPFVAIVIIGTFNSFYKQQLIDRLLVVCDMAVAEVVVGGHIVVAGCCHIRTEPVATLQAEAHSSSVRDGSGVGDIDSKKLET